VTYSNLKTTTKSLYSSSSNKRALESNAGANQFATLIYEVIQDHCSTTDNNLSMGGSSFISNVIIDETYIFACEVKDFFNNRYNVYCPIVIPPKQVNNNNDYNSDGDDFCTELNLDIVFEHFDAFSESSQERGVREKNIALASKSKRCFQRFSESTRKVLHIYTSMHTCKLT
jgi:hypothetical protein